MPDTTALAHAEQLLDWLESFGYLYNEPEYQIELLKVELKFLLVFLKYTVDRCTDNKNLQHLLPLIEGVGQNISRLHWLLTNSLATDDFDYAAEMVLRKIKAYAIMHVVGKIKLVKPEISELLINVSKSSALGSRLSDELVFEFIDCLLERLEEAAYFVRPSLKEGFKVLKTKLTSLRALLSVTANLCNEYHKLDQLFTHVQAVADGAAAYSAYSCLVTEMDEDMASHRLGLQLSVIVRSIDPRVMPEVREIYVGVLEASKSSGSKSDTYEVDETLVHLVDFLLENISELLYHDNITAKDQIETLYEELKSVRFIVCLE